MIITNRDLYWAIGEMRARHEAEKRTLEHYLSALLGLARHYKNQTHLPLDDFHRLISEAFIANPISFEAAWRDSSSHTELGEPGFARWEATVIRQIVDLREMEEAGILKNEYRYFGVTSPRGEPWYNFDPSTYLECAMAGSLGGWEPDDPDDPNIPEVRLRVPGEVAQLAEDGSLQIMDPRDIERVVVEIPQLSWEQFIDFMECGQMYE